MVSLAALKLSHLELCSSICRPGNTLESRRSPLGHIIARPLLGLVLHLPAKPSADSKPNAPGMPSTALSYARSSAFPTVVTSSFKRAPPILQLDQSPFLRAVEV
jgi:hypothetical protein